MKSSLAEFWFALRLVIWLCLLPLRLRLRTLPALLDGLSRIKRQSASRSMLERDRFARTAERLCQLRLFRLSLFPRACLRQALALYYVLTRMGYPAEIHFGARKEEGELHGHSWVTIDGTPIAERTRTDIFFTVYSYPSAAHASSASTRKR